MIAFHQEHQNVVESQPNHPTLTERNAGLLNSPFAFIRGRLVVNRYRRGLTVLLITGALLITGILDIVTGPNISLSVLYLFPVALAAWQLSNTAGILTSFACAGTWLFADLETTMAPFFSAVLFWNAAVRLAGFSVVATLVSTVRRLTDNLENTVEKRTAELRHEIDERKKLEQEIIGLLREHDQTVAHELHDGLAQVLTGISFKAKSLQQDLEESASPYAEAAHDIARLLNDAVGQTRDIARGLDPVEVEADELRSALQRLATETSGTFRVDCSLLGGETPIVVDGYTGLHLYRIAQQAIDNAIRHGGAKRIDIEIRREGCDLHLRIADDGSGFAETDAPARGLGLRSMKFRADLLGGALIVRSSEGKGTRIECRIPEIHPHPTTE